MSIARHVVGLDPEDLTPKQMRQVIRGFQRMHLLAADKDEDEKDEDEDDAQDENDSVVDLKEETKGLSKAPKVKADDLPKGVLRASKKDKK